DRVVAEADTVQDLIDAILREEPGATAQGVSVRSAAGAAVTPAFIPISPAQRPGIDDEIRHAETLTEVLRLRGRGEPARVHIQLYEKNEERPKFAWGGRYARAGGVAGNWVRRGLEPGQP